MLQEALSPVAKLQTIDFVKLAYRDAEEVSRMVQIATDDGFFYLDLRGWKDGQLISSLNACNGIVEEWFKKPNEEKAKTVTLSDAHGYKPIGQQSGVKEGQRDGYESLRLSRDAQLSRDPLPEVVRQSLLTFDDLHFGAHLVTKTILSALADATPNDGKIQSFLNTHLDDKQSRSALYFLHHPPKPPGSQGLGQNIHTDAGTLTLLFTQQPGLQVLSPTTGEWEWVHTREGHGVVNVGDTLRFLSGERFRSALHRVLPLTDEDGAQPYDRYSTAYFLRAADDAIFVGNDGKNTTADEWFLRKFHSFTQDRSVQRLDSVAFGGMEKTLGVKV
ncbi:hypothetical protein BDV27DRAFT_122839 [Aspergillus caelatus]|uniref:Fe2OG dioxygenase domain-containing protein n=1 Tax=Aspergillus caelatus TaxID=61420 RepID=A0A5N7AE46_9EURO|nr:uncharacterized protein BDV27DRAFT_122839 [Aspergillus caelatus]KAE8368137.1 hypothetical protein BDV27DRAFT_122839 [Aspergillus caelatus]